MKKLLFIGALFLFSCGPKLEEPYVVTKKEPYGVNWTYTYEDKNGTETTMISAVEYQIGDTL
jgi:hypothetical protein